MDGISYFWPRESLRFDGLPVLAVFGFDTDAPRKLFPGSPVGTQQPRIFGITIEATEATGAGQLCLFEPLYVHAAKWFVAECWRWTRDDVMIPEEMATRELAKAEAEIAKWDAWVRQQRDRVGGFPFYSPIDRDLAEQILATFEAALADAYRRRNRLLDGGASQQNWP
ncbi:hypothetical protein [Caballeronia sp. BCC1704]|uniref:hypothetical protein n=1 Tax=Caballeronia sp. BCC1704 TaxID=2676300 RepID=UPI001588DCD8|nr:hypothetical protein [Caballeronia sp. BCC1704]